MNNVNFHCDLTALWDSYQRRVVAVTTPLCVIASDFISNRLTLYSCMCFYLTIGIE